MEVTHLTNDQLINFNAEVMKKELKKELRSRH